MRWVTQERLQVDRLASAWLIQRLVDPEAEFNFVPRGTEAGTIKEGVAFHLPGAEMAHHDGRSTFEAILTKYHLAEADPVLAELGLIVRAADALHGPVAFRGVPVSEALPSDAPPEAAGLQAILHGVALLAADDLKAAKGAAAAMEAVYTGLRARREQAATGGSGQQQRGNIMECKPEPGGPKDSESQTTSGLRILVIWWVFLKIGATAFGGLGAALALVQRELVDQRRLLTEADVTEALTYTKLLPGSTVVQVVSYVGYKLGGWPGSALATAAFVLPSVLMMLLLAAGYVAASAIPNIVPAINGLTSAVIGVLLATTYRLGKSNIKKPLTFAIALAAFLTGAFAGVNAALIVVAAGLVGILLLSTPSPAPKWAKEGGR